MAEYEFSHGKWNECRRALDEVLKWDTSFVHAYMLRGRCYAHLGQWIDAINVCLSIKL